MKVKGIYLSSLALRLLGVSVALHIQPPEESNALKIPSEDIQTTEGVRS